MTFSNPIVGGTTLIRPAIQSPNYVPGTSGWIIKKDGSAELNDLTLRGTFVGTDWIQNSDGLFFYEGTPANGNLVGSWTSAVGTDSFGNAYLSGLTLYSPSEGTVNLSIDPGGAMLAEWLDKVNGSSVNIGAGGGAASIELSPPTSGGAHWQPGTISASVATVFGANTAQMQIAGPYNQLHPSSPTISLFGSSDTSSSNRVDVNAQQVNVSGNLAAGNIDTGSFSITPTTASVWTNNLSVSFNKTFSAPPAVVVTPSGGGPGTGSSTVLEWQVTGITTTGFNCRIMRGNLSATTLNYIAAL